MSVRVHFPECPSESSNTLSAQALLLLLGRELASLRLFRMRLRSITMDARYEMHKMRGARHTAHGASACCSFVLPRAPGGIRGIFHRY